MDALRFVANTTTDALEIILTADNTFKMLRFTSFNASVKQVWYPKLGVVMVVLSNFV